VDNVSDSYNQSGERRLSSETPLAIMVQCRNKHCVMCEIVEA
jgi:hypothetical protein